MLIFDEYKYAVKLLNHGFEKFMSNIDLTILAKYFRYIGKNEDQILVDLNNFCTKFNPDFNNVISDSNIKNAIKRSKKRLLIIPDPIPITQKEIDTIKVLKDFRSEKVLFVLLVVSKHFKINLGWHDYIANIKRTEICTRAKIHAPKIEKDAIFTKIDRDYGLVDAQVFSRTRGVDLFIKFVDEEGEPIFFVDDLDNIIDFYPHYCSICGKQIERRSSTHEFCGECWKTYRKNYNKEKMRESRLK
jgi:hypothetical protein